VLLNKEAFTTVWQSPLCETRQNYFICSKWYWKRGINIYI